MPRPCTICTHPEREAIDHALVSGMSNRAIACQWHVGREAVRRHARAHISPALTALQAESDRARARTILDRMESQYAILEELVRTAGESGQAGLVVNASRELRQTAELLARISGELDTRPQVTINLMQSAEYIAVRSAILSALMTYPAARAEVVGRMAELEAGDT